MVVRSGAEAAWEATGDAVATGRVEVACGAGAWFPQAARKSSIDRVTRSMVWRINGASFQG